MEKIKTKNKEDKIARKQEKAQEKIIQKQYQKEFKLLNKTKANNYNFNGDIDFQNVSYTYGKKTPFEFKALDGTEIKIKKDIITAIIGTTGSGKSTLIQLTNGLLISETGRVIVGDYPILANTKKIREVKKLRREIGLVFQFPEYQLFQSTIEMDISFGPINLVGKSQTADAIKDVPRLLELVSLPPDYLKRSPFDLSGGQKRRVAIAGIIAMNGQTLVLDEPTGGLDPQGEEDFIKLFNKLNKEQGKRIILVTHNMDHVLKIADEVVVMHQGKVIKIGTPFEIFGDQELLDLIEIDPPKIYQLVHKLKNKGLDLTNKPIRSIKDFASEFKAAVKK
ncbi:cobalt ABC transporter ATP-binding subunit [Spiroplasma sabaudiense Ar-1343]|uniref:Energy-coupling factor transporter ATP-binding protein EcfA2 n=1 Tax=Spiroplasma sabaudiense Ar-1343 TaxID=1276257 RepID=W6AK75_9MOLU|nr:energy-coupling factor transporter ATPase [Spiroplasma sabaudiense]AHI54129.1 cobalt ABC transporter ATP-binding subunit [Spiroplasma sabaudiense Ar-1343]